MKAKSAPPITRIVLYVRDMVKVADFYTKHFGFVQDRSEMPGSLQLVSPVGGCDLMLLQASKGHRMGQSCIKIVFDVEDIEGFKAKCAKEGLKFGTSHPCEGYAYASARDPSKNLIQISSRAFRK